MQKYPFLTIDKVLSFVENRSSSHARFKTYQEAFALNIRKYLSVILVLLILVTALTSCSQPEAAAPTQAPTESTETQAALAPDFTVYDIDGNEVKLSDYLGTPVVLNFWASWCPPCKAELPDFEEKYLTYGDEVQFLMVNLADGTRETVETASDFIAQEGYTFPVFYDSKSVAAIEYKVRSIPATYFIDADGYIVANAVGMLDAVSLQKGIDLIIPQ